MTEQSLALIQQWMKSVITERGHFVEKLESAAQQHGLPAEEVVAEKRGLSARERLSIYTSGYVARLLECMRADFPVLRRFTGDAVFDAFARAYIVTEPPHSPSLFDLGAGFAQFLNETKPAAGAGEMNTEDEMNVLLDLPAEIARFERARTEVMRAHGIENDPHPSFSPLDVLSSDLKLQTTPCLRLLELKFSLIDFFQEDREESAQPDVRRSFVAISRSDYRINAMEIERWQFAFLRACERAVSAHIASRRAAEESGTEASSVLANLVLWLPVAIQSGFLRIDNQTH
jgi:hypothetical protein